MRRQALISGLSNTQKIRFMVNGFGMHCKVLDVENIATSSHADAVRFALTTLANYRVAEKAAGGIQPVGMVVTAPNGLQVQVDLV